MVLKAVWTVLVVVLALPLVFLFATGPRATLLYLGAVGLFGLASARPGTFMATLAALAALASRWCWSARRLRDGVRD